MEALLIAVILGVTLVAAIILAAYAIALAQEESRRKKEKQIKTEIIRYLENIGADRITLDFAKKALVTLDAAKKALEKETSFDRYLQKKMEDPEFAAEYAKVRADLERK